MRNKETIRAFRKASNDAIKREPRRADEIRSGRKATENIINALAPRQDCNKLSQVAVGEKKPPPPKVAANTSRRKP